MIPILLIFSFSMLSMMTKNIISMWYFMELSSMIFIFFMIKEKNPFKSSLTYFIVSVISSMLIMLSISIPVIIQSKPNFLIEQETMMQIMMSLPFLIKMGVIPFHSWMFFMTENMKFSSMMILFSIMKLVPIWFISIFSSMKIKMFTIFVNMLLFLMIPMKNNNSFFLISSSSIMNKMWILLSSMNSIKLTILFSISYFLINSNLIILFKKNNIKIKSEENSMIMLLSTLSLMGFPPMPLFFFKMTILKNSMSSNSNMMYIMACILICNIMTSLMYMKFMIKSMMEMKNMKNWNSKFLSKILLMISIQSFIVSFNMTMLN